MSPATGRSPGPTRRSLVALCRRYWVPVYSYVRRCGHSPDAAALADEVDSLGHIPDESLVYVLDTFLPEWSHFDLYSKWDKAVEVAKDRFAWIIWQLDKHGIIPRNKTYMKSYIRSVMGDHPALRPGENTRPREPLDHDSPTVS